MLYARGEEARIVGISGYTVILPRARKDKPKVFAFSSGDLEKILTVQHDLVFGFSDTQADTARDLIKAGVAVHVFNQRSLDDILAMIETVGRLVRVGRQGGIPMHSPRLQFVLGQGKQGSADLCGGVAEQTQVGDAVAQAREAGDLREAIDHLRARPRVGIQPDGNVRHVRSMRVGALGLQAAPDRGERIMPLMHGQEGR